MKEKSPYIFVLDDDPDILNFLEAVLKKVDIKVKTFSEVDDFIKTFAVERPDLCLIDINMRERSDMGFKVLSFFREKFKKDEVIILLMSANDHPDRLKMAKELLTDDFLSKPIDDDVLLTKLYFYFDCPQLESFSPYKSKVPKEISKIMLLKEIDLVEVHESGLVFQTDFYASSGTVFKVESPTIQEMCMDEVLSVVVDKADKLDDGGFSLHCQFTENDKNTPDHVRRWLFRKKFDLKISGF